MFPDLGSRYQFIHKIDEGGAGIVWQAVDTHSGRRVAVKRLKTAAAAVDGIINKFKIEANIYLMLNHKNIVMLKNFIITDEGDHYLIMEYIDGTPIDKYVKKFPNNRMPQEVAIAIMKEIVKGIGYGHQRKIPIEGYDGVLHLDIKPSNVMVSNNGQVKIIDYGISQGTTEQRSEKIMGTLMFMAPCQLDINSELDNRTDIYALGLLFYYMLTGSYPHPNNLSNEDIFERIINTPINKMPKIKTGTGLKIQLILEKATEKSPIDRYQNCNELLTALNELD